MTLKERLKKIGNGIKTFWNEHRETIIVIGGAAAATGACVYAYHKLSEFEQPDILIVPEVETEENAENLLEEKTKWNRDWDNFGRELEFVTHQPLGVMDNGDWDTYRDPLDGNCFMIAGYNSIYNDDPDRLAFYAIDNEGYFHRMPDDVHYA